MMQIQSSMPLSPVVGTELTQPTSRKKQRMAPEFMLNERIQTLFIEILTTPDLNCFFMLFSRPKDLHALGHVNKKFREKLILEKPIYDLCIADNQPLSILNICRVQHLIFHRPFSDSIYPSNLVELIKLEGPLGVKIRPFLHTSHLTWTQMSDDDEVTLQSHDLGQLKNYTTLQELSLLFLSEKKFNHQITPHLPYLARTLNRLNIHFSQHEFCLEPLTQLTGLKSLELAPIDLETHNWRGVSQLSSLDSLALKLTGRITDAGLNALEGLTALRELDLVYCEDIYAAKLVRFAERLQHLHFRYQYFVWGSRNEPLQGDDAHELGRFTALQSLDIRGCKLTEVALLEINKLHNLQALELDRTKLDLSSLTWLRGLTALRELKISPIPLNDNEGLDDQLWTNLPALQTITVGVQSYLDTRTFTRPMR